jgi:uncharacterized SAM-binding protein YcdF (DUF218 family)
MLFFNKFLPLFLLPIGWVAGLLVLAIWRKQRWPAFVALAILAVASLPAVGSRLLSAIEQQYPALRVADAGPADAVVVLGGLLGPRAEAGFVPNFSDASERFEGGVALLQAGRAGHLVFTGAGMNWADSQATEGDELRRLAIARGAPPDRVLVAGRVGNTADEAAAIAALMKTKGWKRVILVTTAWHMPRSVHQFRKAGVDCQPFPVDFRVDRTRGVDLLDFVPRGEAWMQTETALRETYGYWFYRIFR